ncbi:MAG: hypothetical protein Q8940_19595 [Bacteroidota bacterium]|nr:hypothetical protein [Bacteroidota bacterium]
MDDTILVNSKDLFVGQNNEAFQLEDIYAGDINRLENILNFKSKNMKVLGVCQYMAEDGSRLPMLKVKDKYGLFFGLLDSNYLAYNLLLKGMKRINLDSNEKILEYVDFLLRFTAFYGLNYYRINKTEDIWTYPQFIFDNYYQYSFYKYTQEAWKVFNPNLLVENLKMSDIDIDKKLKTYKNYNLYSDTLRTIIKPVEVITKKNKIIVKTFMAAYWNMNISFWEFTFENNGRIINISKTIKASQMGNDFREENLFL